MTLTFHAEIQGRNIHCTLASDTPLSAPTFCFSLMAAARVVTGGTLTRSVAGYSEVLLPDLHPGEAAHLILTHANPNFRPVNRAWLPLGGYLRVGGETFILPTTAQGVIPGPAKPTSDFKGLRLIPQPTHWTPTTGTLNAPNFAARHPAFDAAARLAQRLNLPPLQHPRGAPVTITVDPAMPAETYTLTLSATGITVTGSETGLFYAAITLLTLRETHGPDLPCGTITDAPRFGWRGQMLDCARHFFEVATILRLLDLMALLKMNRFHWHLADDEAFRLQVTCAADLWQQTQYRGEGQPVPGVFGGGIRSGGSYSRADVQTVLAHATALNIQVLPEIEIPAHAYAINRVLKGLRDATDNGAEISIQGYPENILNPAMQATWDLVEPLTLEVASWFPIGMLHLGCDELPPDAWQSSPAARRLMGEHGLQTRDDLQGWMMAKLAAHLVTHGIRPAAWEEAAKGSNGGIGNDALLFSWTGQGPGVEAARQGYDVVMCPAQHAYLDMAHTADPDDWGAAWAAFTALEDTINWQPVPNGAEDIASRVIGVQSTYWGEFTTHDRQLEPMLAPRILGIAHKGWDSTNMLSGPGLRSLAYHYAPLFIRIGWQNHSGA